MLPEAITSLQNPRVKNLIKLRDRRRRDRQGLFLVEGYRELHRALEKKVALRELYYCPDFFLGENEPALIQAAEESGAQIFLLSKPAFAKCAYRERPDGLLGVAAQWRIPLEEIPLGQPPFLLVVEGIEKPGNLGTLLRAADAAGVDGVIVCDPVTDIFNPNVVRASTGVLFAIPIAITESATAIAFLKKHRIRITVTTPPATTLYTDAELGGPNALVMGSEQYGLSELWLQAADQQVRIPMAGQADSLNVAMATVITLFEAVRQRGSQETS